MRAGCLPGRLQQLRQGPAATAARSTAAASARPGEQVGCYTGPDGTQNVGVCKGGLQTCNAQGTGYGACQGEVLPGAIDICANGLDDNCNGAGRRGPRRATATAARCAAATAATRSDPTASTRSWSTRARSSSAATWSTTTATACKDNARRRPATPAWPATRATAHGLRQGDRPLPVHDREPAAEDEDVGRHLGELVPRPTAAGAPDADAKSIRTGFGTDGTCRSRTPASRCSRPAAPPTRTTPTRPTSPSRAARTSASTAPPRRTGSPPTATSSPTRRAARRAGSTTANDSIMLKLRVRVPTNAKSFNVQMYFFSLRVARVDVQRLQRLLRRRCSTRSGARRTRPTRTSPSTRLRQPRVPGRRQPGEGGHGPVHAVQERPVRLQRQPRPATTTAAPASAQLAGTGFDSHRQLGCGGNNTDRRRHGLAQDVRQRQGRRDDGDPLRHLGHLGRRLRLARAARRLGLVGPGLAAGRAAELDRSSLLVAPSPRARCCGLAVLRGLADAG